MPSVERPRLPVLFLAPVPDFKGGAERSLFDLLSNPGVAPALVVPAEGALSRRAAELGYPCDVLGFGGIESIRRPFRPLDGMRAGVDLLRAARGLTAIAMRRGAALVHSNGLKAHAIAVAARRLGGRPTVIHIRDIAHTRAEIAVWRALRMGADRTVVVSRACWPGAALPGDVDVVHNAFRLPEGGPADGGGRPYTIGFVGRIHPHKGLHVLIEALAAARRQGSTARLAVRGAFAAEAPGYRSEIEAQIARLGLADSVSLDGFVEDPAAVYAGIDVVCMPSLTPEPFGRAAMEGMGRGLPVIASPNGGSTEMIRDGETGFFADTTEAFAERIAALERDPALRAAVGRRAQAHARDALSLERLHGAISAVYDRAIGRAS